MKLNQQIKKEELIKEYEKQFGGFPYYLFLGASDEFVISAIEKALQDDKEISNKDTSIDY